MRVARGGPDHVLGQEVLVDEGHGALRVREGWHAADGEAAALADEGGVGLFDAPPEQVGHAPLVDAVGAAGQDEDGLSRGAPEEQGLHYLRLAAPEGPRGVPRAARRLGELDERRLDALLLQRLADPPDGGSIQERQGLLPPSVIEGILPPSG